MSKQAGRSEGTLAEFSPTKYQDQFLRGDKRYLAFVSGVGAGKTYAGIIRTFLNMERWNQGEMGAILAPTRQMVVNVIIPEMRELGLLDKWEYNSSYSDEPGLHSPSGSRALILSADNQKTIERLRGLNLAWGWIDERTAVPKRAQEILSQRLRTGSYRNLYETTTPKGKDDVYEFYVGSSGADKQPFGEASIYETDDRLAIVGVPTRANPNTPEDYKDAMEQDLPDDIRAQEVEGEFVEIGAGVLTRDMLTFVDYEDVYSDEWVFHVGVDIGVTADATRAEDQDSDYWCAAVVAVHRRRGEAFLIDVARDRGMTLHQGVEWLQRAVDGLPSGATIVVESNQAQRFFLDACKEAGLSVNPVEHTSNKEDRILQLSVPFENDTIRIANHPARTLSKDERKRSNQLGYDPRYEPFVQEWIAFPEGTHDDTIDAVEIAVDSADILGTYGALGLDIYGQGAE